MNDRVDFRDDQVLAIGAEVASVRFRFSVDGIALGKLGEVSPLVDLLFEIFRGRNIGQQHQRHSYFQWREEFVGVLLVKGLQFLIREFDLGFDPILEELVENQLFPVALRSIADGIALVESYLARFLHQQLSGDEFVEEEALSPFFLVPRLGGLGQFSPAGIEFGLRDLSAVDEGQHTFIGRWRTAGEQQKAAADGAGEQGDEAAGEGVHGSVR